MFFRLRFKVIGGHTYVRVFAGSNSRVTLGKCGDLVFRNDEWSEFSNMILLRRSNVEIVPEDKSMEEENP